MHSAALYSGVGGYLGIGIEFWDYGWGLLRAARVGLKMDCVGNEWQGEKVERKKDRRVGSKGLIKIVFYPPSQVSQQRGTFLARCHFH